MPLELQSLLESILRRVRRIREKTDGVSLATYCDDLDLQDICERSLIEIGESTVQIRNSYAEAVAQIRDYPQICGLKNILVHESFCIDHDRIWSVIQQGLDPLEEDIQRMLDESTSMTARS